MVGPLAPLFYESIDQVRAREVNALRDLLDSRGGRVVLVGAGTLGQRAVVLLKQLGALVLAFTDSNSANWGIQIAHTPVLSPTEATSIYGDSALFLVTIWNDRHWFRETFDQLTSLGCTLVSSYAPLFWRFPDSFLQLILLNELPHRLYSDAIAVLEAEKLWSDEESLDIYRANIRWRALGDGLDMPGRPETNTYFPNDLFKLEPSDCLVDCGAFDGDTVRQALEVYSSGFEAIHAIEADKISCARFKDFEASLAPCIRNQLHLYNCAVGSERGVVRFESDGSVNAKISDQGTEVELLPIDEIFSESKVTFIKMDIEGAEYDALLGARKVIQREQPVLAICVYHTQNDIWRIPLLVRSWLPDHLLFLRAYEGDGFQTVFYAIPEERCEGH